LDPICYNGTWPRTGAAPILGGTMPHPTPVDDPTPLLEQENTVVLDMTRRQTLKRGAAGLTVLSAPGWLAACGGRRGDGADAAQDDDEQATAKLKRGGTLVVAVDALTGNSDPGIFATFGNWMAIDCMARSLTHIDYRSTEPQPAIAERWEVSADGRTYRFFLREGMRFPTATRSRRATRSGPSAAHGREGPEPPAERLRDRRARRARTSGASARSTT
jgi:hypothetical protein